MFILLLSISTSAASPSDYKKRVEMARIGTDELFESLGETDANFQRETIAEIEKLVPATERIEWPGGSVETRNAWLRSEFEEFAAEQDHKRGGAILTRISERLLAISESVGELQRVAAHEQTKDQDKQKLAEILRRVEYQKPPPPEPSLFQKWLTEFLDWLARMFPTAPATPGTASGIGSLQLGLQILIYALVIGLVGFLIYKFAPFLSRRFGGRTRKKKQDRVILGERVGADESAIDLFSDAERLAREGNLRAAIRKGYIAFLCDLSDRRIVRLARYKTNRDYLRDVGKNSTLFESLTGLTRNYESNWYGLRSAQQADWEDFRDKYKLAVASAGFQRPRDS